MREGLEMRNVRNEGSNIWSENSTSGKHHQTDSVLLLSPIFRFSRLDSPVLIGS